jgi:transketolase
MLQITNRDGNPYGIDQQEAKRLQYISECVRRNLVETLYRVGRGHPGSSLSIVEILVTLYFRELRLAPLYAALAERGLIPKEELDTFESLGTRLQGSVDSIWLPWVELTTGSLGQGLSVSLGIAIGATRLGKDIRSYCVLGDGETEEGNVWEAAMCAAKFKQNNLLAIVDWNGLQGGVALEVMPSLEPYAAKWEAFGWHAIDVPGHDIAALLSAYHEARQVKDKPTIIVARTVKGKGVSYMEDKAEWHGGTVTKPLYEQAMSEINARLEELSDYAVVERGVS